MVNQKIAPTVNQAIAYVTAKEHEWGQPSTMVLTTLERDEDDVGVMRVVTRMGTWDVWFQPDGSLYGEC